MLAREGLAWTAITLPTDQTQRLKDFTPDQPIDLITLAEVGVDDIRDIVSKSFDAAGLQTARTDYDGMVNENAQLVEIIVPQAADWLSRAENPGPVLPLLSLLLTDLVATRREARRKKTGDYAFTQTAQKTVTDLTGVLGRLGERAWAEIEKAQVVNPNAALSRLLRQLVTTGTSEGGRLIPPS